jgi:hypothetical protein
MMLKRVPSGTGATVNELATLFYTRCLKELHAAARVVDKHRIQGHGEMRTDIAIEPSAEWTSRDVEMLADGDLGIDSIKKARTKP